MLGMKYETAITQVECRDNYHLDSHMMFCNKLIEELPNASEVIMTQLSLKAGMKRWKGKGR